MRTAGRGFGIFHEMWRPYSVIIEKGLAVGTADLSGLSAGYVLPASQPHLNLTLVNRERTYVESFQNLLAFSSVVKDEISGGDNGSTKIGSLLEAARGDTRRTHSGSVKKSIGDWHSFSPGLSKQKEMPRGWDHDECGRLLCPPSIEWNDT